MRHLPILIIDDEASIRSVLRTALAGESADVLEAASAESGLAVARTERLSMILLDLGLPDYDGVALCRSLRAASSVPIVVVSARHSDEEKARALDAGADDYVTKPFSVKVLLERVKALRRRRTTEGVSDEVTTKLGIIVDRRRHQATAEGKALELTRSEFRLLDTLIRQPGRVFQRSELIDAALGEDTMVMERTIDVHIRALRRKLAKHADVIETVRGVGYRFRDTEPIGEPA
jgi:two-component system phosphate regulon response regulator PhoB